MTWSDRDASEDGYATAAAAMIALALGLTATAVIGAGVTDLQVARRDLQRTRAELDLGSAHAAALSAIMVQGPSKRLRWTNPAEIGFDVLAEAETPKLPLTEAAKLSDADLARLGVVDPERLRSRLRGLAVGDHPEALRLAEMDPAPLWRACAASMISPYGRGRAFRLEPLGAPGGGQVATPPGEVWRVRITAADGWSEERLLRLTGDPDHPAAIIERRRQRSIVKGEPCADLIG